MTTLCESTGKMALSRSDAARKMRELQRDRWSERPELLNIYKCRECRRWHVGHQFGAGPRNPKDTTRGVR